VPSRGSTDSSICSNWPPFVVGEPIFQFGAYANEVLELGALCFHDSSEELIVVRESELEPLDNCGTSGIDVLDAIVVVYCETNI